MPQQKKFIATKDAEVAKKLAAIFKQINNSNGVWVFLNEPSTFFNFDQIDKTKLVYTNILTF